MRLHPICPCDLDDGNCPYDAETRRDCEYWCGEEEDPEDNADEVGYNPYIGAYDYDC